VPASTQTAYLCGFRATSEDHSIQGGVACSLRIPALSVAFGRCPATSSPNQEDPSLNRKTAGAWPDSPDGFTAFDAKTCRPGFNLR
jgi:hypothetical protein